MTRAQGGPIEPGKLYNAYPDPPELFLPYVVGETGPVTRFLDHDREIFAWPRKPEVPMGSD